MSCGWSFKHNKNKAKEAEEQDKKPGRDGDKLEEKRKARNIFKSTAKEV